MPGLQSEDEQGNWVSCEPAAIQWADDLPSKRISKQHLVKLQYSDL
jgi:hypothetical protein